MDSGLYQHFFEMTDDALFVIDRANRLAIVNMAFEQLLGYSGDQILGQEFITFFHENDRASVLNEIVSCWPQENLRRQVNGRMQTRSGEYISVRVMIYHHDNHLIGKLRKHIDDIIRQLSLIDDNYFKIAFELAPISMVMSHIDGRIVRVNQAFCSTFGYTVEEATRLSVSDISHPDDLIAEIPLVRQLKNGEIEFFRTEKRYFTKSGETVHTILKVSLLLDTEGNPAYLIGQMVNITQRKETEEALRQSEEHYRLLSELTSDYAYVLDMPAIGTFRVEWVTNAFSRTTGYSIAEIKAIGWEKIVHPDDQDIIERRNQQLLFGQSVCADYRLLTKTEAQLWVRDQSHPIIAKDTGRTVKVYGAARDITRQKHLEDELKRHSLAFENISDAVIITSLGGRIIDVNPATLKLLNYRMDEVLDKEVTYFQAPGQAPDLMEKIVAGVIKQGAWAGELIYLNKNGHLRTCETNIVPLYDEQQRILGMVSVNRDITERINTMSMMRLLDRAIDSADNGILITDMRLPDNPVIYCNPAFEKISGYDTDEVLGRNCRFLQGPDHDQPGLATIRAAISRQGECQVILRNYRKNGEPFWNELSLSPIRDENGEVTHYIGIVNDISEYRETQENLRTEHELLTEIMRTSVTAILVVDPEGRIMLANNRAEELLELRRAPNSAATHQPVAWRLTDLEGNPIPFEKTAVGIVLQTGESVFDHQLMLEWPDGRHRYLSINAAPLRNRSGEIVSVVRSIADITERKLANDALRQAKEELEFRVEERTQALVESNKNLQAEIEIRQNTEYELIRAKEAAESANRAKSEFLANISHELRTPLNGILGYAQILKRSGDLTDYQREGVDIIHSSGQHLLELINDILDLSKIEAGRMEVQRNEFHLLEFLQRLIDLISVRTTPKDIVFVHDLAPDLPKYIRTDENKLRQILLNLLGNAVKFTDTGQVIFRVQLADFNKTLPTTTHHSLRFIIQDTGIGIPEDKISLIFKPFQQAGKHVEGTGLGLTICQKLVKLLGGQIHLTSRVNQGSIFTVDLNVEMVKEPVHMSLSPTRFIIRYEGPQKRILIVDDKWENRIVLANMLVPLGFEILEAEDGYHCLEKVDTFNPDVILLDMMMPGMDGFEVTTHIRAIPKHDSIIIIAVTASAFDTYREQSFKSGCNDFITKPVLVDDLCEVLERQLGLKWIHDRQSLFANEVVTEPEGQLILPDQAIIDELYRATIRGNVKKVSEILRKIEAQNHHYTVFVNKIKNWNRKFQINQMMDFFKEILAEGSALE